MSTVFITGCATGFGHALAHRLLGSGWRVVATDPILDGLEETLGVAAAENDRLLLLPMDLGDAVAVDRAVQAALAWSPVDVLVNNGGYAVFGTQEESDLDAVRAMFEVNLFGAMRTTQALLPTLRERAGTVVQVSSIAGRMVFPESGFYAATKYALEALSEALFEETCTFGVKVRLIEPGSHDTCFLERARAASKPRSPDSPYAHLQERWDARKFASLEEPQDPEQVVDAIVWSLQDDRPFLRIPVGLDAERILGLRDALTPDAWVSLMARRNGLQALPGGPGGVLTPEEVCALSHDAPSKTLSATLAALRFGHLEYWEESEVGRAALAILRRREG
jgi:NAD(P)-dependent dehydrogenase (short-subunit alcohol dehydrogenase family)